MAIVVRGKSACSICNQILRDGDDIIGTPHFIADTAHQLYRFSDSAMHQLCFEGWEHAQQFRSLYDKVWAESVPHIPREMRADGSIVPLKSD